MRYQKAGEANVLDFVGIVQDYDDPEKRSVILRSERGNDIRIPIDAFQSEYKLLSGGSAPSTDAIKETLSNIRQISTIRFVALPFFLGASAALANAFTSEPWSQMSMFAPFGLGLALIGVAFEIVLSRNLKCWWEALRLHLTAPPWNMIHAHRNPAAVWVARIALFLPYLAMVFYWSLEIWGEPWAWGLSVALFFVGVVVWQGAHPPSSG